MTDSYWEPIGSVQMGLAMILSGTNIPMTSPVAHPAALVPSALGMVLKSVPIVVTGVNF